MTNQELSKDEYQKIYEKFKDHKKVEGFDLKCIHEVSLPFWLCRQKIVVQKEIELDRFSKILLELVKEEINSHSEICLFLGIKEDDFTKMQFHFLLKHQLLEEELKNNEVIYQITHEGIEFLEKRTKIPNIELIEFEYFYNDLLKEYMSIYEPIDKIKKRQFSGYNFKNYRTDKHITHSNKPIFSKIKQTDFAQFFNKQHQDQIFYDFDSKRIELHKRFILFLKLVYENKDDGYSEYEIRQSKKSVKKFDGYVLEKKLSESIKNKDFVEKIKLNSKEEK